MIKFIRFKIFDKTYKFKPFTVKDYRDLLIIRSEYSNDPTVLDELLEDLYPSIEKQYRFSAFIKVFSSSLGKDKIKVKLTCKEHGNKQAFLDLYTPNIDYTKHTINQGTEYEMNLVFRPGVPGECPVDFIKDSLMYIEQDNKMYEVASLGTQDIDDILANITSKDVNEIMKKCNVINYEILGTCCIKHTFTDIKSLYEVLFDVSELFEYYKINRYLVKNGYTNNDVMDMMLAERTISVAIVSKEEKNV